MNLNGSQPNLFQWLSSKMASAVIGLIFWIILFGLLSCPMWLPAFIEQLGH